MTNDEFRPSSVSSRWKRLWRSIDTSSERASSTKPAWAEAVARYQTPDVRKSVWQIVNSFVPFVVAWYLAYRALSVSYALTLALAALGAGFMMRLFIIQHDCGHGSFFKSKTANDIVGSVIGVLTLTPYFYWRRQHSIHHATAGNLDRRGVGDVYTMTVKNTSPVPNGSGSATVSFAIRW